MGKLLIIIGGLIMITGFIIWLGGDIFSWFGKLPGDIKIEKDNFKIFIPITSMLIISILLSLIFYILNKFR